MQTATNIVPFLDDPNKTAPLRTVKISKNQLISALNFINFKNDTISMNLRHDKYSNYVSCPVMPQACSGDQFNCLWAQTESPRRHTNHYRFQNLELFDGRRLLLVSPELVQMNDEMITFKLADTELEVLEKTDFAYPCKNIEIQLVQNSVVFKGSLKEFSAYGFKAEIEHRPPQTFQWIDLKSPVSIMVHVKNEIIYSGQCQIIDQSDSQRTHDCTFKPIHDQIRRFKPKTFRCTRQQLIPTPDIVFRHPIIDEAASLKVHDLSGLGFSVFENESRSVLLPGLIIPNLSINFPGGMKLRCKAQVVYRKRCQDDSKKHQFKCGLTILDMDVQDHVRLLSLLYQAEDPHMYLNNDIHLNDLWDFFFETGFVYPEKYAFIEANKKKIRHVYEKIYTRHPSIARHFVRQENGRILGHMATIRFYPRTWLIHHHAARKSESIHAGLAVLNQIGRFINDSHNLYSINMDYLMCYYRPANKFPNRVFGGAQNFIKDPKGCSTDSFAYLHYNKLDHPPQGLPEGWNLFQTTDNDLWEIESLYEAVSGGLMLQAIGMKPGNEDFTDLSHSYRQAGLKREHYRFSLKRDEHLKAIFEVNTSDIGLNMSDLTSCIKIIILDPDQLSKDVLYKAVSAIASKFEQKSIPLLIYPEQYVNDHDIDLEKTYTLWILNTQHTDHYFKYLNKLLRFIRH